MRILFLLIFFFFTFHLHAQKYDKLNSQGVTLFKQGNYSQAAPYFEQAIAVMKKENQEYNPNYIISLYNLADTYEHLGEYKKVAALYLEAADTRKITLGKKHKEYATALVKLGVFYGQLGLYSDAEPLYLEAMNIREEALGKEHPLYAECLSNLANLYDNLGQYEKAKQLQLEDLRITEKTEGKNTQSYATSLNNLGTIYNHQELYVQSEACYLEALKIYSNSIGEEKEGNANCLNNLAVLYDHYGQYKKAMSMYKKALVIIGNLYGYEHPKCVNFINNLATLYQMNGDYENADLFYKTSLEIAQKAYSKESRQYALALNNYAMFISDQGKYDEAEKMLQEVIAIYEKVLGKEHPEYALALSNLGTEYFERDQYAKAKPLLIEAKKIIETIYGTEHSSYSLVISNLALNYYFQNLNAKAEPYYLEAMQARLKQIAVLLPTLSEKEKQEYIGSLKRSSTNFMDFALAYSVEKPSISADLYNYILATKGIIFQSGQKMRSAVLESGDQELIALYEKWKIQNDYLVQVWQASVADLKAYNIDPKKAAEDAYLLEKELSKKANDLNISGPPQKLVWQDIQKQLKPGEAVIEIIRAERLVKNKVDTAYAVLLITPQTQNYPSLIILGNGGTSETKGIKYYRNCIKFKMEDVYSYNTFWKNIAQKLTKEGIKKVYVSADGIYHQLNLLTLQNPVTKKYVRDETEIQLISSSNDLVAYSKNNAALKKSLKEYQFYLFGYPNYSGGKSTNAEILPERSLAISGNPIDTNQRFLNSKGKVSLLPGTKKEVENINVFAQSKQLKTYTYIENEANEQNFKKLKNPDVLHIATHGFFLADVPKDSSKERGFSGIQNSKISENPLLRSGLLLADCEKTLSGALSSAEVSSRKENMEDGILSAQEAISLNLDKTDLVVLSACETGLGQINNGEGVYGLQRSFQQAGAKTILMSLWTVSDAATQEMMSGFYTYFLSGKNKREAFMAAQNELRKKYPAPYYWGAFVMVGE